jgi:hypothetical protein
MEKSSKRGKIPQSDWPLIMARYEAGETLASIARTYDCSPPAISYVVSRSRARQPGVEAPPTAPSTTVAHLIKAAASEPPVNNTAPSHAIGAPAPNGEAVERPVEIWPREANGHDRDGAAAHNTNPPRTPSPVQRPPAPHTSLGPPNGDHRRTLHLSLGNTSQGNGGTPPGEHHPAERHNLASENHQHQTPQHQTTGERFIPTAGPEFPGEAAAPDRSRDGTGASEARPPAYNGPIQRTEADVAHRREGAGSYIDRDLRARVDGDIAAFLAAFDAALVEDTQESRAALREATDRLLRAGARTRIELERLEARIPLPQRENLGRSEMAWRHR